VNKYDLHFDDECICWLPDEMSDLLIPLLLGGYDVSNPGTISVKKIKRNGKERKYSSIKKGNSCRIAFSYPISHPTNTYRMLSIPHPNSQLVVLDFYKNFEELILYYCNVGSFSVRRPVRVASCEYWKAHGVSVGSTVDVIEEFKNEYESLRSYFSYKDYSNIFKVYDSPRYLRCEKKYSRLLKLDITRCFESIYTHSLVWAVYTKDFAKQNMSATKTSFAGKFDKCIQSTNYDETNGILIGPEFSRVFAEIILQRIDRNIEDALFKKHALRNKVDYEIMRYVDDYFIFINDEAHEIIIKHELSAALCEYKLFLNKNKCEIYEKPIITPLSVAKRKVSKLLDGFMNLNIDKHKKEFSYKKYSSRSAISDYKSILNLTGSTYAEALNYSLVICENALFKNFGMLKKEDVNLSTRTHKENLLVYLRERLDFLLFLYAVNPTVNSSVRIARIVHFLKKELATAGFSSSETENLDRLIFDVCYSVMKSKSGKSHGYIEISYMLSTIKVLGRMYRLSEDDLANLFGIQKDDNGNYNAIELNYFAVTSLLHYIGNTKRYWGIKKSLCSFLKLKFKDAKRDSLSSAEITYLLLDAIACPFLPYDVKNSMLATIVTSSLNREKIINTPLVSFSKWHDFNMLEELIAKKSFEVY
jgi:hypothetical protein